MSSSLIERECEPLQIDRFSASWLDTSNTLSYGYDKSKSLLGFFFFFFMQQKQLDHFKYLTDSLWYKGLM